MDKRTAAWVTGAGVIALAAVAWLTAFGGHVKLSAQLRAAADVDEGDGLLAVTAPPAAGPARWRPHTPAGAHLGRHRLYRHPATCSPGMTAAMSEAWRYDPPSEGDL